MFKRALFTIALVATLLPTPKAVAADPNAYVGTAIYIPSKDGTKLRAWLYRPARPKGRTPVIMTVTPYAGSGGAFGVPPDVEGLFNTEVPPRLGSFAEVSRLFARGYSLVEVELRGYGGSGGCYDFGGLGEQMDAAAAVEWAARQPWSTGKVGMFGHSYDGESQLMAMKGRPKGLAAVILGAPPSGYRNLYTNGVRHTGGGTAFGAYYAVSDLWPASLGAPVEETTTSLTGTASNPTCYAEVVGGSYNADPKSRYWRERDIVTPNTGVSVPTMLAHGFNDWNVRTTNYLPEFSMLNGPHRGFFGPWDHGIPHRGDLYVADQMAWFDRWLKGIVVADRPPVSVQNNAGRWRAEEEWPPPDTTSWTLPLRAGAYLNASGNSAETGLPDEFPVEPPVPLPTGRGLWTVTQPLAHSVHLSGLSQITATVVAIGQANLIALVYDIDAKGNAQFAERGAYKVNGAGTYSFTMYPQDWRFERGHRIGVLLTGADDVWFEPTGLPQQVTVLKASIRMPILRHDRSSFLKTGPFNARPHHPPFAVGSSVLSAAARRVPLPARAIAKPNACSPHDSMWWRTHRSTWGYDRVAARAARRSYGLFRNGSAVISALSGSRGAFAAHLLNLAASDLGTLTGFRGLDPASTLSAKVYDRSAVGTTARAATHWLRTRIGTESATRVTKHLTSGTGVECP